MNGEASSATHRSRARRAAGIAVATAVTAATLLVLDNVTAWGGEVTV